MPEEPNPELLIMAHKYLYYVKAMPVLTDYQYDLLCSRYGIEGGGGSDRESDYSDEEKQLAGKLLY